MIFYLFALWLGLLLNQRGTKFPLVFIDRGLNVNNHVYFNMLQEKLCHGLQKLLRILTSSHRTTLQLTQWMGPRKGERLISVSFGTSKCGHLQVLISIPWTFAIRSIFERDVSTGSHPILDSLKAAIQSVWKELDQQVVRRSCASVRARLRFMIKARGGHFKMKSGHYVSNIILNCCVKIFLYIPSCVIFKTFFWSGKLSGPPCKCWCSMKWFSNI